MKKGIIEKTLELGTFISFSLLVINVMFQIITRRYIPSMSVVWTEEMSRLLFVYSVSFAAPLAMKRREYVNVELFHDSLPQKIRHILNIVIELITISLFGIVFFNGLSFVQLGMNQVSVTMGYKMSVAYVSIPLMTAFILMYSILHLMSLIKKRG